MLMTKQDLTAHYQYHRDKTAALCKPLVIEDYVIQSMEDVSPPKWHLAHTTWFFETFVLTPNLPHYQCFNREFHYLFNSYYQSIGHPYPREKRGILSRPTVETIYQYRQHVDHYMADLLNEQSQELDSYAQTLVMGLNHEQQHQELLLMDIKYNFYMNPDYPVYQPLISALEKRKTSPLEFIQVQGGLIEIGDDGTQFCYDNELPRHPYYLRPYRIANRLVTNEEFCEFIEAGGYQRPEFWLSEGWEMVKQNHITAPLYWQQIDNRWFIFTLSGLTQLNPSEPVSHVNYYEADAFARWKNLRLPTEYEWEHFVSTFSYSEGNFLEKNYFHPMPLENANRGMQFFGDLWEWTSSSYGSYPGYQAVTGALGEYNGKFMSNQMVLRGGCCLTPRSHIRKSYRNFYPPNKRWQFSGIRLAADV